MWSLAQLQHGTWCVLERTEGCKVAFGQIFSFLLCCYVLPLFLCVHLRYSKYKRVCRRSMVLLWGGLSGMAWWAAEKKAATCQVCSGRNSRLPRSVRCGTAHEITGRSSMAGRRKTRHPNLVRGTCSGTDRWAGVVKLYSEESSCIPRSFW